MLTVVMNFVCTEDKRLKFIVNNAPGYKESLGDFEFIVNFNDELNEKAIREAFQAGIPKLSYFNNKEKDFAAVTYELSKNIKTPYVLFLAEDYTVKVPKEELEAVLQEVSENDIDFVNFTKIEKYNRPQYKNMGKYVEGEYGHFYKGRNSPPSRLSIQGLFKTELWLTYLKNFLDNKHKPIPHNIPMSYDNLPNYIEGYYDFSLGPRGNPLFVDLNCYIPKKVIFDHWDEVKQKFAYIN